MTNADKLVVLPAPPPHVRMFTDWCRESIGKATATYRIDAYPINFDSRMYFAYLDSPPQPLNHIPHNNFMNSMNWRDMMCSVIAKIN